MPNRFWPDTKSPTAAPAGIGNAIQQNSAVNNPDVFCESHGSGYRLPSIGEFKSEAREYNPGGGFVREPQPVLPGHWSNYANNNINLTRLTNVAGRAVSGSILNEWGDLSKYPGFAVGNYWSTEISVYLLSYNNGYSDFGRFYTSDTGVVGSTQDSYFWADPITNPRLAALQMNVSCVRDLVPTPSTPNPGKS